MNLRWEKIRPEQFEELCYHLLAINKYMNLTWLGRGGGDRGRDIIAWKTASPCNGMEFQQKWVVQCKRYTETPPSKDELAKSINWCQAHKPNYLLFIITNVLSPDTRDWLDQIKDDYRFQIIIWDEPYLERQIVKHLNDVRPYLPSEVYDALSEVKFKPPYGGGLKPPETTDWRQIPEFKESYRFFEENDMADETAKFGEMSFLKVLLGRLKTRNLIAANKEAVFSINTFRAAVKDVVQYVVKLQDNKCMKNLKPTLAKLNEKKMPRAQKHVTHELIKHMYAKGLISGPGDYVVVY